MICDILLIQYAKIQLDTETLYPGIGFVQIEKVCVAEVVFKSVQGLDVPL